MMEKKNDNPEKEAKDREFYDMMQAKSWQFCKIHYIAAFQDIDMQSAKRMHSIKSKKRELRGA